MRLNLRRIAVGLLSALTLALALALPAGHASAATTTLNGDWAPFNRCPVDNSAMLAADGTTTLAYCVASDSPSGSVTLGKVTAPTGDVNLQLGLLVNNSTGATTVVTPSGGAISAAPVTIPGGLLGLMCPSKVLAVSLVCSKITSSALNKVTAVVQPAGDPSSFSLANALGSGQPIVTIPVKIQLQNSLLGSSCYLGSDSSPILLHPENATAPNLSVDLFDGDGTADATSGVLESVNATGATQSDNTAAIPGATGCGLLGILNAAIDLKTGLPSASGSNSFTLNNASSSLAGLVSPGSNDGQQLAQYWNSALQS